MSALKLKTCYCESKKIETGEFFLFYYDIQSAPCKEITIVLFFLFRDGRILRVG